MKHKRLLLLGLLVAVLSMVTSPVRANIVVLDDLSADYEIQDGDTLIGVLSADIQIYTANTEPITFTLQDAHIRIFDIGSSFDRNCLTIGGDATLLLDGSSELVAPITRACIAILEGATLTIDSETAGELDATPGEQAAAIGTDYFEDGGNLIIKGGRIIANADQHSPGIGAATGRKFGTITIEATTLHLEAGIGYDSPCSIGHGDNGATCGTVTDPINGESAGVTDVYLWDRYEVITDDPLMFTLDKATHTASVYCMGTAPASIVIPDKVSTDYTVVALDKKAFASQYALENITLPETLEEIGEEAFFNCYNLLSITIPESVKSIGYGAFLYCKEFTGVTIPAAVESIGANAFEYCSALTDITVDSDNAHYCDVNGVLFSKDMTLLHTYPEGKKDAVYAIPEGVTVIEEGAFYYATYLTEITIPEGVTEIGIVAFAECYGLTSLVLPSTLESVGDYAFLNSTAITGITCKAADVPSYGLDAFAGVDQDIPFVVPFNCSSDYAATDWSYFNTIGELPIPNPVLIDGLYYTLDDVTFTAGLVKSKGDAYTGDIVIPASVVYHKATFDVESIEEKAFDGSEVTSVTLGEKVSYVAPEAFYGGAYMTTIDVDPANITFSSADGVLLSADAKTLFAYPYGKEGEKYTLPATVTTVSLSAFKGNPALHHVTLPPFLSIIDEEAFANSQLEEVIIPASVTDIGFHAFVGNNELKYIISYADPMPITSSSAFNGVDTDIPVLVPEAVFDDYNKDAPWNKFSQLTPMPLPDQVIDGINYAFDLGNMTASVIALPGTDKYEGAVEIPAAVTLFDDVMSFDVTTIKEEAFYKCNDLSSLFLPETLTTIEKRAISNCDELTTIDIPESVTFIGTENFNGKGLTAIDVEETNTHYCSIDGVLFNKAKTKLIQYPLGSEASKYEVPDEVAVIGTDAFTDAQNLTAIDLPSTITTIEPYAFAICSKLRRFFSRPATTPVLGEKAFYGLDLDKVLLVVTSGNAGAYTGAPGWKEFSHVMELEAEMTIDGIRYTLDGVNLTAVVEPLPDPDKYEGEITIPATVTWAADFTVETIGYKAFADCPELTKVSIPKSVQHFIAGAFINSSKLGSVVVDKDNTYFKSVEDKLLYNADATTLYAACPVSLEGVVTLPAALTRLEDWTFYGCEKMEAIELPASLNYIGGSAFENCTGLTYIKCKAATHPWTDDDAFKGVTKTIPVYVPKASIADYKAANEWKDFTNYIALEDDEAAGDVIGKIAAIGTVEYTDACKTLIDDARKAYDALNSDAKALIEDATVKVLTDAEAKYAELKAAAEKAAADEAAAKAVDDKIDAIGTVEYTDASKALIDDARKAYDELTEDQKALISDEKYKVLTDAEAKYAELKAAAEKAAADKAAADAVIGKIDAIGTVEYTDACHDKITAAREAYNKLTEDQKALISDEKYKVLTDAEAKYEVLKAQAEGDQAAADLVIGKIDAIGTVVLTDECHDKILAARGAYDALTDAQKALISAEKYKVLTDAEAKYAELVEEAKAAAELAKAKEELNAVIAELEVLQKFAHDNDLPDIEATLGFSISTAKSVAESDASTLEQVQSATTVAQNTLNSAENTLLAIAKTKFKGELDKLLKTGDSAACEKIVADAKDDVDAITIDTELSAAENIIAVQAAGEAILKDTKAALEAQRASEVPTGFDNIEQPSLVGQKVLRDGKVYILVGDKMYDAAGKLVK